MATRPIDIDGCVTLLGREGNVELGGFNCNTINTWNIDEGWPTQPVAIDTHKVYIEDVIKSIENNDSALVDGFEGYKTVEFIEKIYEACNFEG